MIAFTVDGDPQTKGSAKAFVRGKTAKGKPRVVVMNDNAKCAAWASSVSWKAKLAMSTTGLVAPWPMPVRVSLAFTLARPKTTKLAAPRLDIDKLTRAVLDALTGIVYVDDKQVVDVRATKSWGAPGVRIEVEQESRP